MRALVGMSRLVRALLHLLLGLAVMAVRFRSLDAAGRQRWIQRWSAHLLHVLGIDVQVHGVPRRGATWVVANHVSWFDIAAIHAIAPQARFVSKADVRRWPFVGWLVAGAGTLFVERASKRDALRVCTRWPMHFAPVTWWRCFPKAPRARVPRCCPSTPTCCRRRSPRTRRYSPSCCAFTNPARPSAARSNSSARPAWLQSLWRVGCAYGLCVRLEWLPPHSSAHADRRRLAATLHDMMGAALLRSAAAPMRDAPLADNGAGLGFPAGQRERRCYCRGGRYPVSPGPPRANAATRPLGGVRFEAPQGHGCCSWC